MGEVHIRNNQGQNLLLDRLGGALSPLSQNIVNSVFSPMNSVTIILAQGPLNLTPLISGLYAQHFQRDVLVALPSSCFDAQYEIYTRSFFSLLSYGMRGSFSGDTNFLYGSVFWAKGELDEDGDELLDLKVKTYPKYGLPGYKKHYDEYIRAELRMGCHTKPQVVFIPVKKAVPAGITGKKTVKYGSENYPDSHFEPSLIILESINERPFNFDGISQLIKNAIDLEKKLVLHFSWPYLLGLEEFLAQYPIENNDQITIFHLGKRLCLELKSKVEKPPSFAIDQSLEDKLWDTIYYPHEEKGMTFKVLVTPSANLSRLPDEDEVVSCKGPIDDWVDTIRECIRFEPVEHLVARNLLLFPPVVDSFLCPSELKIKSIFLNSPRYITLQDYVRDKVPSRRDLCWFYNGLCSEVQNCTDLPNYINGLYTRFSTTKNTLLHLYMIQSIQDMITTHKQRVLQGNTAPDKTNLILLNLHPFLGSRSALLNSIIRLFETIATTRQTIHLPIISKQGQDLILMIRGGSSFTIKDICDRKCNIQNLRSSITSRQIPITLSHVQQSEEISEIMVAADLDSRYLEVVQNAVDNQILNRSVSPLVFYSAVIRNNDYFEELSVRNVHVHRSQHLNKIQVNFNLSVRTPAVEQDSSVTLNVYYGELDYIKRLSREEIQNSRLLIPGAIPFHIIIDDRLMICEHFDTLLLPFKEVVFFSYPGNNFKRLMSQISSYKALFSTEPNEISNIDLQFSLKHCSKLKKTSMPELVDEIEYSQFKIPGDTAVDVAIRQSIMDPSGKDEDEVSEIVTLKQIWNQISEKKPESEQWRYNSIGASFQQDRPQVQLIIQYDDGKTEEVTFAIGTLLRKKIDTGFEIYPVEEVVPGDNILYIEAIERESVDNFLLRDYLIQKEIQLEQILEPITCLKFFYDALKSIQVKNEFMPEKVKNLYWLDDAQKSSLCDTILFLLRCRKQGKKNHYVSPSTVITIEQHNNFWENLIEIAELLSIFNEGRAEITYKKFYAIAAKAGIVLSRDYFIGLCSVALHTQKHPHYFFRNEENLLNLAKMLKHTGLELNYLAINELGQSIGTTLQIIGRCVSRVASGRSDPFNEMDCSIENKLKMGVVKSVSYLDTCAQ